MTPKSTDIKESQIVHESGSYIYCYCPQHQDSHPSLAIKKKHPYRGNFYCYGCGWSGKVSEEWLKSVSKRPIKIIPSTINWEHLNNIYKHEFGPDYSWPGLRRLWGVCSDVIKSLDCGWDGSAWTFPFRDEQKKIIGIQRYFSGRKCCVEGSRVGLFIPSIIPDVKRPLYITEGIHDLAALLNLSYRVLNRHDIAIPLDLGYQGIGRASCLGQAGMIRNFITQQGFGKIVIIADNDDVGIAGAHDLGKSLTRTIKPENISIFIPPKVKDFAELVESEGKEKVTSLLEKQT